ncbi:MAG: 5-oxoprolinase subunit PxpA [Saprospiraceae bacterium]
MHYSVDLNCDMGEGMSNDALLMPLISSANIACGYHAGDEQTMQQTIELALQHRVKIGAHPSFPDRENFGRTNLNFPAPSVTEMVKKQIELLAGIAQNNNARLHHVKPHGALYNMASRDKELSEAICTAILETDPSLVVYAQSGSMLIAVAESLGLKTCSEVFADRAYQPDGFLIPRTAPNALIHKEEEAIAQVLQMVIQQTVTAEGKAIPVKAETICVHGDGAHALEFARGISEAFRSNNISIRS